MKGKVDWKTTAEFVGIGAIVLSLVFVALQLKQSQDIAIAELRQASQSSKVELTSLITNNSDIWVRGNAGEELSDSERSIHRLLVESQHWQYWTAWSRGNRFGQDIPRQIAVADFAGFLDRNPGALSAWHAYIADRETVRQSLVLGYEENRFISAVKADLDNLRQTID